MIEVTQQLNNINKDQFAKALTDNSNFYLNYF